MKSGKPIPGSSSVDMDTWLSTNGIAIEEYTGVAQGGSQLILISRSVAAFQKTVLDWEGTYSKEFVSKSNSGTNAFTYLIVGQNKGYTVTLYNTSGAVPGSKAPGSGNMGWIKSLLAAPDNIHGWFDANPAFRALFKQALMGIFGFVVLNQVAFEGVVPPQYAGLIGSICGFAGVALHYMQSHTTLPIVGARAPQAPAAPAPASVPATTPMVVNVVLPPASEKK